MNKKVLSLILALVMVLGTFANVFAAEAKEASKDAKKAENGEKVEKIVGKDNKIQYIIDKKFVEGYEDGSMGYDKNITRAEITRLLVLANGNEDLAKQLQGSLKIYSDVELAHWANGVINVGTTRPSSANGIAMLAGYPDGSFKPDRNVSYAELAKMLVVLVKKDLTADMVKNAKWATSWMTWAAELGILEDVNVADSNAAANRADAFTMLYNALFYMKEFKRVPANEVRGIVSELNKSKLVLNEEKDKEYTITADTVYVNPLKAGRSQYVTVYSINFDKYMLGSLVRVLVNDKKEVTHIIELGNPADLAIGNAYASVKADNATWAEVADNTVETELYDKIWTLKDNDKVIKDGTSYVTIGFKSDKTKANSITFHNVLAKKGDLSLRVTDKTEVYVANPYNNIMKKVSNINEALLLIGFRNYEAGYRIPNVYAGFNSDGARDAWKGVKLGDGRDTATVIVFNVVSKYVGGDLYRVLNSASSQFKDTLEDVDGKLYDRNNWNDTSVFPLNYGDHLDVIEVNSFRDASNKIVKIDHSDVRKYPIVEVVAKDGSKYLEIKDVNGEKSLLDIRDADIFSAKRFDTPLSVGSKIQFRVENHKEATANNVAEIISILPRDTKLEGSIYGVIPSAFAGQERGRVVEVTDIETTHPTVTMIVDYNLFDYRDSRGYATFNISRDSALKLKEYAGTNTMIEFKVFKDLGWAGHHYASDFRLDGAKKGLDTPDNLTALENIKKVINELAQTYGNDFSGLKSCAQLKAAEDKLAELDKYIKKLSYEESAEWTENGKLGTWFKGYTDFSAKVDDVKTLKKSVVNEAKRIAGVYATQYQGKEVEYSKAGVRAIVANLAELLGTGKDAAPSNGFTAELVSGSVKVMYLPKNQGHVYGKLKVEKDDCCVFVDFTFPIAYKCPEGVEVPAKNICIYEDGTEANCAAPGEGTCNDNVCSVTVK